MKVKPSGVLKVYQGGHYEFLIMLYGLPNALVAFRDSRNQVSGSYHGEFVMVFIIFMLSKS